MTQNRSLKEALPEYLPELAVGNAVQWFEESKTILKITRDRRSKLGDFRNAPKGKPCTISINYNLNKYSFLIVLLHEMAHAEVFFHYTKRCQPHGKEWKAAFSYLATPYLSGDIFPHEINLAFKNYLINPSATSIANVALGSVLRKYDNISGITVSMLSPETLFLFSNGKTFRMIGKIRKRYKCYCLDNKKTYLFSPLAPITPLSESNNGKVN